MSTALQLALTVAALGAPTSLRADFRGNGGDVVVCGEPSPTGKAVMLLDHFEAQKLLGLTLDLGAPNLTFDAKIELVLERLSRHDPVRADYYRQRYAEFWPNALVLRDVELTDIPDSAHIAVPATCHLEQIAIRKPPELPHERLYTIDGDLWDALDADGQAGLILHEIIFGEMTKLGQTDSVRARYFNAHLSSTRFAAMGILEYQELLETVKLNRPVQHGEVVAARLDAVASDTLRRERDGTFAVEGDSQQVVIQRVPFLELDKRGVVELSVPPLPANVEIQEAYVQLDMTSFTRSNDETPQLRFYAFAGDGLITPEDATRSAQFVGESAKIEATGIVRVYLNPVLFTRSLLTSGHLGLRIQSALNGSMTVFAGADPDRPELSPPVLVMSLIETQN